MVQLCRGCTTKDFADFFFSFSSVVALLVTGFGDLAPLFPFCVVQLYCSPWLPSDND